MRRPFPTLTLAAALALAGFAPGCSNEANDPDAKVAEKALGVDPKGEPASTEKTTRDVTVVKDTKVIDNASGQTISETKESTPVKVVEEKKVSNDVKVDVGNTAVEKK